jgi:hypothetical protein
MEVPVRHQELQLFVAEAQIPKVNVSILKFGQFGRERIVIPVGQLSKPVVSQQIRALFDFAEVVQDNDRSYFQAQLEGAQVTSVARDNAAFGVDQDRRVKSELRNPAGYLGDPRIRVPPGVFGVRRKCGESPALDALRHFPRKHCLTFQMMICGGGAFRRVRFALACRTEPLLMVLLQTSPKLPQNLRPTQGRMPDRRIMRRAVSHAGV